MNTERDIGPILDRWLSSGPTESPERVLAVVTERIGRQRQRSTWRLSRWDVAATRSRWVTAGVALVLLVAVAGIGLSEWAPRASVVAPSATVSPSPTSAPSATSTPTASPTAAPTALGELAPGRHTSSAFPLRFSYSVPEGWWNDADDRTAFLLSRGPQDANNIELLFDAYPPILDEKGCQAQPGWDRPHATSDLLAYWRSNPALKTVAREAAVGGLRGWNVNLWVKSGWKSPCGADVGVPAFVVHWYDGIPSTQGMSSGENQLTILDDPGGQTIVLQTRGDSPRILGEESAIVDTIAFDAPHVDPPASSPSPAAEDEQLPLLRPGKHATGAFDRPLTYTVPSGWTNAGDRRTSYHLDPPGSGDDEVQLIADAYFPLLDDKGCMTGMPAPDQPHGSGDWLTFLRTTPEIVETAPKRISIDGVHGWQIDVGFTKETRGCVERGDVPFYQIPYEITVGFGHPMRARLVILDHPSGATVLAIITSMTGSTFEDLVRRSMPVVKSIEFAPAS